MLQLVAKAASLLSDYDAQVPIVCTPVMLPPAVASALRCFQPHSAALLTDHSAIMSTPTGTLSLSSSTSSTVCAGGCQGECTQQRSLHTT